LISAARLVAIVADRLDPISPRPFRLRAQGTDLLLEHPDGWGVTMSVGWIEDEGEAAGRTPAELASLIVGNALDELQDSVSESSKNPWPPLSTTVMAPMNVRTDGVNIFFWYGISEAAPVIGFAPIAVRDLARL
jgi:hypothetical protein